MENPIEMDDLGVPLFSETSICSSVAFILKKSMKNLTRWRYRRDFTRHRCCRQVTQETCRTESLRRVGKRWNGEATWTCRILHDFWWGKGCHSITGKIHREKWYPNAYYYILDRKKFICSSRSDVYKLLPVTSEFFKLVFHIQKPSCASLNLPESPQKFRQRLQGTLGLSYQVPNCCSSGGSGGYLLPDPRPYWMPVAPWVDGFIVRVIPLWKRYPGLMFGQVDSKIEHEMKNVAFQFPKYCFNVCWIYFWT